MLKRSSASPSPSPPLIASTVSTMLLLLFVSCAVLFGETSVASPLLQGTAQPQAITNNLPVKGQQPSPGAAKAGQPLPAAKEQQPSAKEQQPSPQTSKVEQPLQPQASSNGTGPKLGAAGGLPPLFAKLGAKDQLKDGKEAEPLPMQRHSEILFYHLFETRNETKNLSNENWEDLKGKEMIVVDKGLSNDPTTVTIPTKAPSVKTPKGTGPSATTTLAVGVAATKEPRGRVLRWSLAAADAVLFMLILVLLGWEQCATPSNPH